MNSKNVVFLYSRFAGYFFTCVEKFVDSSQYAAHIVHWEPSKEAPYQWQDKENIFFHKRNFYSKNDILNLLIRLSPKAVYVVNWIDKIYLLALCEYKRKHNKELIIIAGFDPPWRGKFKQYLAQYFAFPIVRNLFSFAWVTGTEQYEYARRIGFSTDNIFLGLYCADLSKFHKEYHNSISKKRSRYPKELIFVGRLIKWKGVKDLYEVFINLTKNERNGWKLRFIGNGKLKSELKENKDVRVSDFIQPEELPKLTRNAGAFCLPSWDEHWGVVVQEFAAGGLPLLISDMVSSSSEFLIPGFNGYQFKAKDKSSLRKSLVKLFAQSDEELIKQGSRSYQLSQKITPEYWTAKLNYMING